MAQSSGQPNVQAYLQSLQAKSTSVTNVGGVDISDRITRELGHVIVDKMPSTAVTVATLPLPTGASTSALQSAVIGVAGVPIIGGNALYVQGQSGGNTILVDGSGATQPTIGVKLASATYAPLLFQNLGANSTLNVKSSPGNVYSLTCCTSQFLTTPSIKYIQLHNTNTVPLGGAVPIFSFMMPKLIQIIIGTDFFTNEGVYFPTGIAFAFSTTMNTYTAAAASEQSTYIQYK